jgi:prevent-host-death family protein
MARKTSRKGPLGVVGVRELRQNLSIYLDRVKKGEALTVTENGHPVAILRPIPPLSDVLSRLVAEGRVTPPTRSLQDLPRPIKLRGKAASKILDELREDRI